MGLVSRIFEGSTLVMLKKGIEGTDLRHRAIANNIANVDTPNYHRATVAFEEELQRARMGIGSFGKRAYPRHFVIGGAGLLAEVQPRVIIENDTRFRPDRNNVNIDEEMADLAENTQRNLAFTELLSRRYRAIEDVLRVAGQA